MQSRWHHHLTVNLLGERTSPDERRVDFLSGKEHISCLADPPPVCAVCGRCIRESRRTLHVLPLPRHLTANGYRCRVCREVFCSQCLEDEPRCPRCGAQPDSGYEAIL